MFTKMGIAESYRVNTVPESWKGLTTLARPSANAAAEMMDKALEFTAARAQKNTDDIIGEMVVGDLWTNSTFRYALAKEIFTNMRMDADVRGLYIHGSVMDDQARLTSDIDLILHVANNKEEYETWVEELDEIMVSLFRNRFSQGEGFKTLIDCHVVTDEEVSRKAGYGSLLSSIHSNITQIS